MLGKILHLDTVRPSSKIKGIPGGYTYFGQFIDHDLVLSQDSCTNLNNEKKGCDSEWFEHYKICRKVGLNLNPVYAGNDNWCKCCGKLLFRTESSPNTCQGEAIDIPRNFEKRISLIPDKRNDENWLVAQLHLQFIKLHNKFCDLDVESKNSYQKFDKSKSKCIQVYRQIIKNDYLKRILSEDVYQFVIDDKSTLRSLKNWSRETANNSSKLQLIFEKAAFRFGHTMVRESYILRKSSNSIPLRMDIDELFRFSMNGARKNNISNKSHVVEWDMLFDGYSFNESHPVFPAIRFKLPLLTCPENHLAIRNLIRGEFYELPSFNRVCLEIKSSLDEHIGNPFSTKIQRHFDHIIESAGQLSPKFFEPLIYHLKENQIFDIVSEHCPLWLGILCEAYFCKKDNMEFEKMLGPAGSLLVAAYIACFFINDEIDNPELISLNTMQKLQAFLLLTK
ncbi:peroxidase family protein [Aliiglaciecola lipolytica]|nr:peroxidase family protein [Aliiglaciecola lipolytica]